MYQINTIKELKEYLKDNNINNSDDLGKLGLDYWNNKLKPIINPKLFKIPNNKKELKKLIEDIDYPLLLIDTSGVTEFKELFNNNNNNNLKSIEYWNNPINYLGFWNTDNITNIFACFYEQNFFNQRIYWNTSNVKDSSLLFAYCESFNQPVEFDLFNCKKIICMFEECYKLNSQIKLINLDNVKDAEELFSGCKNLNKLIELDLSKCQNISFMFDSCNKLNSKIILNGLDKVENAYGLFYQCNSLNFNNIESIINKLVIKFKDINELEKEIKYQEIPEEYKNKIKNKQFSIVNKI